MVSPSLHSSRRSRAYPARRSALATSVLAIAALPIFLPGASRADQLATYTFGTSAPGVLTPTTVLPNLTASNIAADAGLALDLTSPATAPASSPYLRTTFTTVSATQAAAFTNNADFRFTLTANSGYLLNLASLTFDAMKGGASGIRGYAVRSSADNYASVLSTADLATVRPNMTNINVDLSGSAFQGLANITFKIFSYSPAVGSSVDYDSFVVNGVTSQIPTTSYIWLGNTNGIWDTTTANWSGLGTIYPDAAADSNVAFENGASTGDVTVSPNNLSPNSITFNNSTLPYVIGGSALNVATAVIKNGSGTATLNNAVTAGNVTANAGTLIVGSGGSLTTPMVNIPAGGSVSVAAGGALGAGTGLTVSGNLSLSNNAQIVTSLTGVGTGVLTLDNTSLTVTNGVTTYTGKITGTGSLIKNTSGTLTLSGATSDFSGGITVSGANLELTALQAAGTGAVTVSNNGVLSLGAGVTNAINLNGGTIGVLGAITTPATVTVTGNNVVKTYNPVSNVTSTDLIFTGLLQGTGNITLMTLNGNAPDNQGFRLRGGASSYSGTITVNQSAKFELQTALTSGSQMGTGTLVMTGGTFGANQNGTFSLVNLRNNSAAAAVVSDTTFGNNVQIAGTGTAIFNMLGSPAAGSFTRMGELTIGNGQTAVAASTGGNSYTLAFSGVRLTGGNATFVPQPIGNANYIVAHNISLGPISETIAGSGFTMNGGARLTLNGASTYTGATNLLSGTTVLATGATLAGSSSITVAPGAFLDATNVGTVAVPTVQTLTVNGTLLGSVSLEGILSGGGQIIGSVTALNGALVAPGNSAGLLTTYNVDLQTGATLVMEVAKASAGGSPIVGSDYDVLSVTDTTAGASPTVKLGAALQLSVGSGIEQGDIFTLILNNSSDGVSGTFGGLANGAFFTQGGQAFQISYADDSATAGFELTGGNDVSILAVPEPGSVLLLLGGLGACAIKRRRGRRS